jgi:hypothetical protein
MIINGFTNLNITRRNFIFFDNDGEFKENFVQTEIDDSLIKNFNKMKMKF